MFKRNQQTWYHADLGKLLANPSQFEIQILKLTPMMKFKSTDARNLRILLSQNQSLQSLGDKNWAKQAIWESRLQK